MNGRIAQIKARVGYNTPERIAELNRVPNRAPSRWEIIAYLATPCLLGVAGAFPVAAIIVMPAILVLLYLLYRRFGVYLPMFCVACYGAVSLSLNYDVLTVVYLFALFFGLIGIVVSCCVSPYLACVATAAIVLAIGAIAGVAVVRLAERKSIGDIASEYIAAHSDDAIIHFYATDYYDSRRPAANEEKLTPDDAGYEATVTARFSDWANDEFTHYIWYYCIHYGGVFGAAAFIVATLINRRTASAYDIGVNENALRSSTRAMGGVRVMPNTLAQMKLPRAFLLSCVLPAFVASIVLYFVGGYGFITSTITHTFITLPASFGCFTLFAFFAGLFKGRARTAAYVILGVLGVVAMIMPVVLFFLGILGLCDCIVDLRYWTKFIMEE